MHSGKPLLKRAQNQLSIRLLQRKTWNYLRYIHAKNALNALLSRHPGAIRTVLVIGCGTGLAELLLAAEYPDIHFTLTDHEAASHKTDGVKTLQQKFNINNISWSQLNILSPGPITTKYDLVYSIEVLEHIQDDQQAADNMHQLSNQFIFCLVPFAEESKNINPAERRKAWERNEHHICGYNMQRLIKLFPSITNIKGCYWNEHGLKFRQKLTELSKEEIKDQSRALQKEATDDIIDEIPSLMAEAQGIWITAKNK